MNLTCATIAAEFEMAQFIVFCLLLFAVLPSSAGGLGYPAASDDCLLWFTSDDNGSCDFGNNLGGVVKCSNVSKETYLLGCFCTLHHLWCLESRFLSNGDST